MAESSAEAVKELEKSKKEAIQRLREARRKHKRNVSFDVPQERHEQRHRLPQYGSDHYSELLRQNSYAGYAYDRRHRSRSIRLRDNDEDSMASLYQDAMRVAEEQARKADAVRKADEAKLASIAADAVERYKRNVKEELDQVQQAAEAARESLSKVFNLTPDKERIDKYLDDLRARELGNKEAGKLLSDHARDGPKAASQGSGEGTVMPRRSSKCAVCHRVTWNLD